MARIILIIAMTALLALPPLQAGSEPEPAVPRAPYPKAHELNVTMDDFALAPLTDLELTEDGGLRLRGIPSGPDPEQNISSADYSHCYPAIGVDSKDNFIVAWQGVRGDSGLNQWGILSRTYDSAGKPLGPPVRISDSDQAEHEPVIAVNSTDCYVIAWWQENGGIYARMFDAGGNPAAGCVEVSAVPAASMLSIAVNSKDEYLIAWCDNYAGGLKARMLDRRGMTVGSECSVCEAGYGPQCPDIAALPDNGFMAVWFDGRSLTDYDIYARRLDPRGSVIGSEICVSSGPGNEASPRIAVNSTGAWMVLWTDSRNGPDNDDILAQRFDAANNKVGEEIVLAATKDWEFGPKLVVDSRDNYIIAWQNYSATYYICDVFARVLNSTGAAIGGVMPVCTAPNNQYQVSLGAGSSDCLFLAWTDERNSPRYEIYGRRYGRAFVSYGETTLSEIRPAGIWRWSNLTADAAFPKPAANSVKFEVSTDQGGSWNPVPPDGSLALTGSAKNLKIRIKLATTDRATSPTLNSITVNYIVDEPPSIDLPGDLAIPRNTPVRLTAIVSDQDGDALVLRWTQLGGPPVPIPSPACESLSFVPARSGLYRFRFSAQDGYAEVLAFVNVTVSNRAPTVSIPQKISFWKGDTVLVCATTGDPDGDNVTVTWSQMNGSHVYFVERTGRELAFVASHTGRYTLRAVASDGEAQSAPAFADLEVSSRAPFASLRASATEAITGAQVTFDATASSDPDGRLTGYNFSFGDGIGTGWTTRSTATHSYPMSGSYDATVTVKDDDGNETASAPVTVVVSTVEWPPERPTLRITRPVEGLVHSTSSVTVVFSVEDLTLAPGFAHLHLELDGGPSLTWEHSSPFVFPDLPDGRHTVRAFLENASHRRYPDPGGSASVNFSVRRPATRPDLAITGADIVLSPPNPREGESVVLSATVHNAGQADAGAFLVRFLLDGTALPDQGVAALDSGASLSREARWKARPGRHTLTVKLDPAAAVDDLNRTNNEAYVIFTVDKAEQATRSDRLLPIYLALSAAITLGAVTAALFLKRKRK